MNVVRWAAIAAALAAWSGLGLQLWITVNSLGLGPGIWRYLGYFTILTNLGAAIVATAIAFGLRNRLTGAVGQLAALTAIVTVGIIYSLLLRSIWNPTGLQKIADVALHDAAPILFTILWLLMPHGELRWSDLKWALAGPALYLAYALARGALEGWYAYWFLDPSTQSAGELAASIAGVLAIIAIVAAGAIALDRAMGKKRFGKMASD